MTSKGIFTWDVDESRKLVLRNDRHWYCLDAGEPEKLWSVATVAEMKMAADIERLQAIVDRYEPPPCQCEHGVKDGDWCEPCNAEYKRAAAEAETAEKARQP